MTIEEPNIIKRIKSIEERLDKIEDRISSLENKLGRFPSPPLPRPGPIHPPGPPGPPPEPFRFYDKFKNSIKVD